MQDFKSYMQSALQEAGLTDDQITSAIDKIANHEKLAPKLNAFVKTATEDYQAQVGRAKAAQERADKLEKEWYPRANAEYQRALAEIEALKANPNPNPDFDASKYLTRDDFIKMQQERDARYATVIKEATRLGSRHAATFGEELDVDALEKLANETNLPLSAAYDRMIAPRVQEKQKAAADKEKEEYAAQKVKDALSRHKLPTDPIPTESAPIYNRISPDSAPKDMDSELLAAWHGVKK